MKPRVLARSAVFAIVASSLVAAVLSGACGDSGAPTDQASGGGGVSGRSSATTTAPLSSATYSMSGGLGGGDADGRTADSGPTDCVTNPTTYLEIINACTTAQRVVKDPDLSKYYVDGGLPPLP